MHLIEFNQLAFIAALIAIPIILIARYISVVISSGLIEFKSVMQQKTILLLTWGALRGGISLALVMSLGASSYKATLLSVVFVVVIFSIVVQGLSLGRVAKYLTR